MHKLSIFLIFRESNLTWNSAANMFLNFVFPGSSSGKNRRSAWNYTYRAYWGAFSHPWTWIEWKSWSQKCNFSYWSFQIVLMILFRFPKEWWGNSQPERLLVLSCKWFEMVELPGEQFFSLDNLVYVEFLPIDQTLQLSLFRNWKDCYSNSFSSFPWTWHPFH